MTVRFSQVRHETPLRNGAVDLECDVENGVGERQTRASVCLERIQGQSTGHARDLKSVPLGSLRFIIGAPRLWIRGWLFRDLDHAGVSVMLLSGFVMSHHKPRCINVLAIYSRVFVVGAGGMQSSASGGTR